MTERRCAVDRSAIEEETSTTTTTTAIIIIIHYSWQFYWNLNSVDRFSKILTSWNSFRWESSYSRPLDGHTGAKIIIALRNFANAPKNGCPVWIGVYRIHVFHTSTNTRGNEPPNVRAVEWLKPFIRPLIHHLPPFNCHSTTNSTETLTRCIRKDSCLFRQKTFCWI